MRALPVSIVLSSLLLGGWVAQAAAQDATTQVSPTHSPVPDAEDTTANRAPGTIPQPNPDNPGLVTGIRLGELYTDNLRLHGSGRSKDDGWITTVEPFIRAGGASPRLSGMVDYSLTGYLYAGQSDANQLAQHLNAFGTLTMVQRHLFLDARATYGRRIINNALPAGSGTYFLGNNRANVATGSLSPYWLQDLGRVGTMTLRYTRGRVIYNRSGIRGSEASGNPLAGISNITSDGVQFSIDSPDYEAWGWNLSYVEQRLKADSGGERKFARAKLGISREVGPNVRLLADGGKENKYLPDGTVKQLGATFWDIGVQWANSRNRFKILGGHRFYGHSAEFSWVHTAARLTTNLSYTEQPTDLNQRLLGGANAFAGMRFPSGMGGMNGMGDMNGVNGELGLPSLFERRIYLMKRATASASLEMPRGRLNVRLYDEDRDFFLRGNARENVRNADISWRIGLGPFTSITPRYGWRRYRFSDAQINHTQFIEVAAVHQFNPDDFATLRLRHESRDVRAGIPNAHPYRANVIYLQWTHLF